MFKNGYLRLLMTLIGFQRIGVVDDPDAAWIIPSTLSADQLKQSLDLIKKYEFSPPTFEDGQEAEDFIRRVSAGAAGRRATFDDDDDDEDDGIDDDDDDELMFPAGGPTAMKKSEALEALKKTRRRRRKAGTEDSEDNSLTDEQLKARADARRARELEKNRKIKSELFVHGSDEESDEERDRIFFEKEEKLRQRSKIMIMKELLGVGKTKKDSAQSSSRKRPSTAVSADTDDDDIEMTGSRKRPSSAISIDSDEEDAGTVSGRSSSVMMDNVLAQSDEEATDTPMSSPHLRSSQKKRRKVSPSDGERGSPDQSKLREEIQKSTLMIDDEDEEDDVPVARPARQRVRAGFIIDSSDEE